MSNDVQALTEELRWLREKCDRLSERVAVAERALTDRWVEGRELGYLQADRLLVEWLRSQADEKRQPIEHRVYVSLAEAIEQGLHRKSKAAI